MNTDLQHLIQLQELDLAAERLRRRSEDLPAEHAALEERLNARKAALEAVKARLAANQTARREIEKDLAAVQARLNKYKDQLMEVKTNKEYQAMQTEISVAEGNVRALEDRLLERMVETDAITADQKAAEGASKSDEAEVTRARQALDAERGRLERDLEQNRTARRELAASISPAALKTFDHVAAHRRGIALSEAREGHCMQCHVRLRPQVFNDVRRNDSLIQCESCSRILYFVPAPATASAPQISR